MMRVRWTGAVLVALLVAGVGLVVGAMPSGAITAPDSAYGAAGLRVEPLTISSLATTKDGSGRILVAVVEFSGFPRIRVYRYLADGSPDGSFGDGGSVLLPGEGYSSMPHIAVQSSGRILVEATPNPSPGGTVVRGLTTSGAIDETWGIDGSAVVSAGGSESAMVVRQDDSVAFGFNAFVGDTLVEQAAVTLLDPSGHVDQSFGTDGVAKSPEGELFANLAAQGNQLLLVTGGSEGHITRLDVHGAFDPTFGNSGTAFAGAAFPFIVRSDGSFVTISQGSFSPAATRYTPNGDWSDNPQLGHPVGGILPVVAGLDSTGRLVTAASYGPQLVLSRLNADLSPDPSFAPDWGLVGVGIRAQALDIPLSAYGVYPTTNGRTVIVGIYDNKPALVRVATTAPPTAGSVPIGTIDTVTASLGKIAISGWAIDPDTADPIPVHVYVNNALTAITADKPRPDVGNAFPGYGPNHGFATTIDAGPGNHTVCAYAINTGLGGNAPLGCRQVIVPNRSPFGSLDSVTAGPKKVTLGGWTIDPDATGPIPVHVYVDDALTAITADKPRPDVDAAFGLGPDHGFSTTIDAAPGNHTVCAYAINTGPGGNAPLGCRQVTVPSGSPFGSLDSVTAGPENVTLGGWTIDPDTTEPIQIHVYVDDALTAITADKPRPDVGNAFLGYGPDHGFSTTIDAAPGKHTVCAYAINTGVGSHAPLGCRQVTVPHGPPFGSLDVVSAGAATVSLGGWAIDPDTADPIQVHVYVDDALTAIAADKPRPDVGNAFLGYGLDHGFSTTIDAAPGNHTVCAYAINTGIGNSSPLGCRVVKVS